MPWLCFLLGSSSLQTAKPLRFDLTALTAARDSFVFYLNGEERGQAVWQYEIQGAQLIFTATSELRPADAESLRVVMNRTTGAPVSTFHRIAVFNPQSDTVLVEHDLTVRQGRVEGTRRVGLRDGRVATHPVRTTLPAGAVWSDYALLAAAAVVAEPGDVVNGRAYSEFGDTLTTLSLVAEAPATITVPAGTFETIPLRSAVVRLYVTRTAPRRVVKGESLDGAFRFELVPH
ncbi:MAG TPA: hypothetical protein VGQ18_09850 [Gemmatimonadales bacterium]|jgi:hypothetical protein|nr:hypothetical protein [Gemmatimonadales bacterium]